jgi:hypothetical protein
MTPSTFFVKDCALAALATGNKAQNLSEFRDQIKNIPTESIYYHFWRQSIETSLVAGSFYNDFSHWAHYHLHDDILAERLALIDPSGYKDMNQLREDILEVVESRLDEQDGTNSFWHAEAFHFIESKIVVFNTSFKLEEPKDLVKVIPELSPSSIFYHFVDARRREPINVDDFSTWLSTFNEGHEELIKQLRQIDPYFITLSELQEKLRNIVTKYFIEQTQNPKEKA